MTWPQFFALLTVVSVVSYVVTINTGNAIIGFVASATIGIVAGFSLCEWNIRTGRIRRR